MLADYGFHGKTIADQVGCSVSTVYRVANDAGIHLRDYRDGKTETSRAIIGRIVKDRRKKR
jgi:hypothetical protein